LKVLVGGELQRLAVAWVSQLREGRALPQASVALDFYVEVGTWRLKRRPDCGSYGRGADWLGGGDRLSPPCPNHLIFHVLVLGASARSMDRWSRCYLVACVFMDPSEILLVHWIKRTSIQCLVVIFSEFPCMCPKLG
jgi:hypothetical protein